MGDFLTAAAILACDDATFRDEDVPQWGGTVRVRALTGKERDAFEASNREIREDGTLVYLPDNMRAKLVGRSLINPETGERLFTDQQINALGDKNAAVLNRIYEVAAELSGLTGDAGKDSEDGQSASPGSTSATN